MIQPTSPVSNTNLSAVSNIELKQNEDDKNDKALLNVLDENKSVVSEKEEEKINALLQEIYDEEEEPDDASTNNSQIPPSDEDIKLPDFADINWPSSQLYIKNIQHKNIFGIQDGQSYEIVDSHTLINIEKAGVDDEEDTITFITIDDSGKVIYEETPDEYSSRIENEEFLNKFTLNNDDFSSIPLTIKNDTEDDLSFEIKNTQGEVIGSAQYDNKGRITWLNNDIENKKDFYAYFDMGSGVNFYTISHINADNNRYLLEFFNSEGNLLAVNDELKPM